MKPVAIPIRSSVQGKGMGILLQMHGPLIQDLKPDIGMCKDDMKTGLASGGGVIDDAQQFPGRRSRKDGVNHEEGGRKKKTEQDRTRSYHSLSGSGFLKMATVDKSHVDIEQGGGRRSVAGSDGGSDGSLCFSDADDKSWHSPFDSTAGGSYDDPEIGGVLDTRRDSSVSDCSVEVDFESGVPEIKVHLDKVERDCRICHLSLESPNHESGIPIELGCSCKEDLAAAHKHCAEAWFKIKGNKTCEICGATACNVLGANETEFVEQWNGTNNSNAAAAAVAPAVTAEPRNFWHGHRFLNFLLACMVFAFVISWLFHFNVPS
ncbi:hypothetical protein HHK36_018497 [Tetracentron sinense]|uniref:RING-CH-type domain-containing protein n=1 Tax=Tetracentron sinense TaxID=13715 RepID=A0A834Z4H9_TETSI|nr:hypothetical protein HHK36_018497 [Tetracentron sinense]